MSAFDPKRSLTADANSIVILRMTSDERTARAKRTRRKPGQFVEIGLGGGQRAFGRVLMEPLFAFYDYQVTDDTLPGLAELAALPIAFRIWVTNYVVTKNRWKVLGTLPLSADLRIAPDFFKRDPISGRLSIYNDDFAPSYERPATWAECEPLECAAVWDGEHVEDRLRDHFAGRPNRWLESLKLKRMGPN